MTIQFQKATRKAVKLKIAIDGPSGSGKTFGALSIAKGITKNGRIAVADSENESASFYASEFAFDAVSVPDADAATIRQIIDAAVAGGYDALVIDSLSHAWMKVLADKDAYDAANPKSNQWTNWGKFGKKWEDLMKHILDAPIHIIATMRSKQAYEQVTASDGKKKIVKLGLQPQVRDGAEYEFGLVFSVAQSHRAEASKDRTRLFGNEDNIDLADPKLHARLVAWMESGELDPRFEPATREQIDHLVIIGLHSVIEPKVQETIANAVAAGMTKAKAGDWIARIEAKIAEHEAAQHSTQEQPALV